MHNFFLFCARRGEDGGGDGAGSRLRGRDDGYDSWEMVGREWCGSSAGRKRGNRTWRGEEGICVSR